MKRRRRSITQPLNEVCSAAAASKVLKESFWKVIKRCLQRLFHGFVNLFFWQLASLQTLVSCKQLADPSLMSVALLIKVSAKNCRPPRSTGILPLLCRMQYVQFLDRAVSEHA